MSTSNLARRLMTAALALALGLCGMPVTAFAEDEVSNLAPSEPAESTTVDGSNDDSAAAHDPAAGETPTAESVDPQGETTPASSLDAEPKASEPLAADEDTTCASASFSYNPIDTVGKTAADIVAQMTLSQKIQQMIVPAFRSYLDSSTGQQTNVTTLTDELTATIEEYRFGGVILFAENCADTAQTTTLVHNLAQTAPDTDSVPLLVSTDQEGGTVTRLNSGTSMTGNMAIAASGSTANAAATAQILASELSAVGINVDFAPDLDVNTNPANPVIGVRSFSSDPALVSSFGTAFIQGLQAEGMASTVKHFPGHGDTATDSHTGLPKVNKTLDQLQACELAPFRAGIDAGCDMVMTAHIQYPLIETSTYPSKKDGQAVNLPATLSKTIITDLLRNQMGFDGVVSTDALNMDAIATHFYTKDSARLAINAGVDLLLMPVTLLVDKSSSVQTIAEFEAAMDSYLNDIEAMVQTGEIPEARIVESATRIVQMKIDRGIITDDPDTRTLEQKVAQAQAVVGSDAHRATERAIADAAVTVTQNADYTLPLEVASGQRIAVFSPYASETRSATFGLARLQDEGVIPADATFEVITFDDDTPDQTIVDTVSSADFIVPISTLYGADDLKPTNTTSRVVDLVIATAHSQGKRAVVLSAGLPYDAARYPDADALVLAYNPRGAIALDPDNRPLGTYGPNIPAAFDIIFGKASPKGTLPVEIMKLDANYGYTNEVLYPIGFGITNLDRPVPNPVPTPDPTPDPAPDPKKEPLAKTGDTTTMALLLLGVAAVGSGTAACTIALRRQRCPNKKAS